MKILITSALSAKAYQIKNQLADSDIILGDYNDMPDFMISQGKMIKLPNPASSSYAHQMLTLCLDNGVEVLYLLDDKEAQGLAGSKQLFIEYNIDIQTPTDEV